MATLGTPHGHHQSWASECSSTSPRRRDGRPRAQGRRTDGQSEAEPAAKADRELAPRSTTAHAPHCVTMTCDAPEDKTGTLRAGRALPRGPIRWRRLKKQQVREGVRIQKGGVKGTQSAAATACRRQVPSPEAGVLIRLLLLLQLRPSGDRLVSIPTLIRRAPHLSKWLAMRRPDGSDSAGFPDGEAAAVVRTARDISMIAPGRPYITSTAVGAKIASVIAVGDEQGRHAFARLHRCSSMFHLVACPGHRARVNGFSRTAAPAGPQGTAMATALAHAALTTARIRVDKALHRTPATIAWRGFQAAG